MNACPVCDSVDIVNFFKDLQTCTNCTHIFKSEPIIHNLKTFFNLEKYASFQEPFSKIMAFLKEGEEFEFIMPTVVFYGNELSENIYDPDINHYFTQSSLMKLMHRYGFKIKKQDVRWAGNLNETFLKVVK